MRLGLCLALLAAGLAAGPAAAEAPDPVKLTEQRRSGAVDVWAENRDPNAVRWIWLELAGAQNATSDGALPGGFVLRPLERRQLLTLRAVDGGGGFSYALRSRSGEGDPGRDPDPTALYRLPWAHGQKHTVTQGYFGRITHQGIYALDFDLDEGTPVLASRDGVVIAVKDDSNEGGMGAQFAGDGNYVRVLHDDATWAVYAHLRYHGADVQVGQRVLAGERLGFSGHTGLASGPHLHLAVYRATFDGPKTIPTLFITGLSRTASLEEGRTYYAWQAGLPPFAEHLGADLDEAQLRGVTRAAAATGKVTFREERVDRRNLVWADNGTGHAVRLSVDLKQADGVRCSALLPWSGTLPARTEGYCFYVDFVGTERSAYQLAASWRPLP
jgi:murein DD-endopeptidase MepM/ murein hydrolase activator NlpD